MVIGTWQGSISKLDSQNTEEITMAVHFGDSKLSVTNGYGVGTQKFNFISIDVSGSSTENPNLKSQTYGGLDRVDTSLETIDKHSFSMTSFLPS